MKSDFVKKGTERAPHRSLFNAAGYTDEELERPLIGVVNSFMAIISPLLNSGSMECPVRLHQTTPSLLYGAKSM